MFERIHNKTATLPLLYSISRSPFPRRCLVGALAFALACFAISHSAVAQSGPPDATLFTTYDIDATHTNVSWIVCGSTQQTSADGPVAAVI